MSITEIFGIQTAYATDTTISPVARFVGRVNSYIINPLIIFMFALALVWFLFGVFQYFLNSDKAEDRDVGRQHIMYGLIGMFIMFGVFAILKLIESTLGVSHNPNF